MGWRNTFILINRNANFHFVAIDLEEKFMGFCFDGKKLEVMVGNNPRKESKRAILLNSKTLFHYLFHVAEDICCERSWKFLFAQYGNNKDLQTWATKLMNVKLNETPQKTTPFFVATNELQMHFEFKGVIGWRNTFILKTPQR